MDTSSSHVNVPAREGTESSTGLPLSSPVLPGGFNLPVIRFVPEDGPPSLAPPDPPAATSRLALAPAIRTAEMVEIAGDTGKLIYYPLAVTIDIGDVFFLRERDQDENENGIIVQIIRKEAVSYAQADTKTLWRLLTKVRAHELQRAHYEPAETIDLFLAGVFKVRAAIVNSQWESTGGRVVTRNVDIFSINPHVLTSNILNDRAAVNVHIGDFKAQAVRFSGQGFDKVNLITGMKGAGKSHIAKGIINESQKRGMSAIVFDINNEYGALPGAQTLRPGTSLKFRLDRLEPRTFLDVIEMLAPFAERTQYAAVAGMQKLFEGRKEQGRPLEIDFLKEQVDVVFPGTATYIQNMRYAYTQSLEIIRAYDLFLSRDEIEAEDKAMRKKEQAAAEKQPPSAATLTSIFYNLDHHAEAGIVVFAIGGLLPKVQRAVVKLAMDGIKTICNKQFAAHQAKPAHVPVYPTVFFEEAHMYMDENFINGLIPLVRHLGVNLFFITNTPGELPASVFRLLDNLVMTRMVNASDISRVEMCGLSDKETIEGFAPELPDYHALWLSAKNGVTKGFPLVFRVRNFGLPVSGETRSMWHALDKAAEASQEDSSLSSSQVGSRSR